MPPTSCLQQIADDGYAIVPGVYESGQVESIIAQLDQALQANRQHTIRNEAGSIYAARNILDLWPAAGGIWRLPPLPGLLAEVLGPEFGLVRVLYFDKPPDQTWALPWHKDLTIAVKDNRLPSPFFCHPTRKAGVPHVEAPFHILEQMLTMRIHLDHITGENGPLKVVPGSHHGGKKLELGPVPPRDILLHCGDVLLIRPLVAHCSQRSHPGTCRHRRVLHLEFAGLPELPDGFQWHTFLRA